MGKLRSNDGGSPNLTRRELTTTPVIPKCPRCGSLIEIDEAYARLTNGRELHPGCPMAYA